MKVILLMAATTLLGSQFIAAQKIEPTHTLEYARLEGRSLKLDLFLPEEANKKPGLIVYVHGGAWRAGDRTKMPLGALVKDGWAIASVDYRLSPEAVFPAQVHDIKAAVRFLRSEGASYGLKTEYVAIAGSSAGGHLAALVGVTNGHPKLEGNVGSHLEADSAIQAIVSFYGAANLTSILSQSTPHGLSVRVPALELLLGNGPEEAPALAKLASPVFHVDAGDPPLLLLHGDQDPQMPINQSHELEGVYKASEASKVVFEVVHGGAHGGESFYTGEQLGRVSAFLEEFMRP